MKDRALQVVDHTDDGSVLDLKVVPVRDANGQIVSGLQVGHTLEQNKAFILIAHKGDFKFVPEIGVALGDALLDDDLLPYRHEIREQFTRDGLTIRDLDLYHLQRVKIDAVYEK